MGKEITFGLSGGEAVRIGPSLIAAETHLRSFLLSGSGVDRESNIRIDKRDRNRNAARFGIGFLVKDGDTVERLVTR
jgi:hypothetical protein